MKRLARWGLGRLERTGFFRSKPLLAPLLRTLWRTLRAPTPEAGQAAVNALAMDSFARYPILFHDRHDLEYLLYPDQNAEIYLANNGNYEIGETEFCLARLRSDMIVFDVGANIGLYTLLFARQVGPGGRVHAFEPEPRNYRRLLVNLALNGCDNVTPNAAAVFSRSQPVTLHVYPDAYHAWHSLERSAMPDPTGDGRQVLPEHDLEIAATSLDDYCQQHGVQRIDYLKIDVEGAELDVLRGAAGLLARQAVGLIQFEMSPQSPADVFELLADAGFRCHPIAASGDLGSPVHSFQPGYANYAAIRL